MTNRRTSSPERIATHCDIGYSFAHSTLTVREAAQ